MEILIIGIGIGIGIAGFIGCHLADKLLARGSSAPGIYYQDHCNEELGLLLE